MTERPLHVTIGYPRNEYMEQLEKSARRNGFDVLSLPICWHANRLNTIDKFKILFHVFRAGFISDDRIILFTDAYDVLVLEECNTVSKKFFRFDSDIVFNSETNFYPPEGRDEAKRAFDAFPSKWRYLNSGCYMGYGWAIRRMIEYVCASPIVSDPAHGADQAALQDFFLRNQATEDLGLALDLECSIFATLNGSVGDFSFDRQGVINSETGRSISVLHANGDKANLPILTAINELIHEVPENIDLRVFISELGFLEHDGPEERLTWNLTVNENTLFFVVRANRRSVSFTAAHGFLTYCPDRVVHCDRDTIDSWEILYLRDHAISTHGLPLKEYMYPQPADVGRWSPIPLGVFSSPAATKLLEIVGRCTEIFP